MPKHPHYLGEPAFCVESDGAITRTAVDVLGENGECRFLNCNGRGNYFDFNKTLDAAERILKTRIERGADGEKARKYLARLRVPKFKAEVLAQSFAIQPISGFLSTRGETLRRDTAFPTEYFEPGQKVFGIITPRTDSSVAMTAKYPYFILQTRVRKVNFAPLWPNRVRYTLRDTNYYLSHDYLCASTREARGQLVKVFAKETGGSIKPNNIRVIPAAEGKQAEEKAALSIIHKTLFKE